ncbi:sulfite exporter TauE/SafE family protein [Candidatus Peregrinibacteria bacterium]|nr:sulfite exporter TauE/SafE family protein [Candidatus Peregrinibacteria bacterium]
MTDSLPRKAHTFHVTGMHCSACEMLIAEKLKGHPKITHVEVSLINEQITIIGDLHETAEIAARDLTKLIEEHGYKLHTEKPKKELRWKEFIYAAPIAMIFIAGFFLLQKTGFTSLINPSSAGLETAFLIGLIASVSTCLAVVGGLILSLSANYAKDGGSWKPQTAFHISRLVGFFVLGGAIGALGSSFQLGLTGSTILSIIIAVIMLLLGINLLNIFHFTKKLQPTLPKWFSQKTVDASKKNHYLAPVLVGIGTFFLPCGFTQSMQIYSLKTGSFLQGSLTMLAFALGTLPVLALISFGSLNIAQKSWKGIFFKTAGIIVIMLALFNLANALAVAGIINPLFNL